MNVAAPQEPLLNWAYRAYVLAFFLYLAAPLAAASLFAFNDSLFPRFPGAASRSTGSSTTPSRSSACSTTAASCRAWRTPSSSGPSCPACRSSSAPRNAFLFERKEFPGKAALYILMIIPLVIPGVILGISILVFASTIANGVEAAFGLDMSPLRPGVFLVILGQFSFLTTITTLIIAARLRNSTSRWKRPRSISARAASACSRR